MSGPYCPVCQALSPCGKDLCAFPTPKDSSSLPDLVSEASFSDQSKGQSTSGAFAESVASAERELPTHHASVNRKLIEERKAAMRKLHEARQLILVLRADLEAKRLLLSTITQQCKGGIDHLNPTDAVKIKAIHELASQGARRNHESGMYARSLPSEASRGVCFPNLTSRESHHAPENLDCKREASVASASPKETNTVSQSLDSCVEGEDGS